MREKVYFIESGDGESVEETLKKLEKFFKSTELLNFINNKDFVAVKTHFGEKKTNGFVRPEFLGKIGKMIKKKGGIPFLTETSTLYRGDRSNAVDHLKLSVDHGFDIKNTGMPVIMADGLFGDEEVTVKISGKIYREVNIASLISKIQALVVVTHFTGHIVSGFGGALKNIGMGLSSRRGKMIQHSTSKPVIKKKKCTACGECIRWCPVNAIKFIDGKAKINLEKCIGCGECLAVCRFDAVGYNWSESYEKLQQKITEHALGVVELIKGNALYLNFLTRISKDCDCMDSYEKITPDIGILISKDPVAIDSASLYLLEKRSGKKLSELSHNIPYKVQLDHAEEINFGSTIFEIVEFD